MNIYAIKLFTTMGHQAIPVIVLVLCMKFTTVTTNCPSVSQKCDVISVLVNCFHIQDTCLTVNTNVTVMLISNTTTKLTFEKNGFIQTLLAIDNTKLKIKHFCDMEQIQSVLLRGSILCSNSLTTSSYVISKARGDNPYLISKKPDPKKLLPGPESTFDDVLKEMTSSPILYATNTTPALHAGHFIGYIIWGGVACSVLVIVVIAVAAVMLKRRKLNTHDDGQYDTKLTEF